MEDLYEKVKNHVKSKKGMMMKNVASEVGVTLNGLRTSLQNRTAKRSTITKLAEVLEVSMSFFEELGIQESVIDSTGKDQVIRVLEDKIMMLENRLSELTKEKTQQYNDQQTTISFLQGLLQQVMNGQLSHSQIPPINTLDSDTKEVGKSKEITTGSKIKLKSLVGGSLVGTA